MKRILSYAGVAVATAASTLTLFALPAHAESGASCVHVDSVPGFIFTKDYAHGSTREEREFVPGYEGSGIIMVKVTTYRCVNGTWVYEGLDYEARRQSFGGPRPVPILE
jgi:hypothetical protein